MANVYKATDDSSYLTLLHQAASLPELSFTLKNDCEEADPLKVLHIRFDALIAKLEDFEKQVSALAYRPASIIPFTGAVTGLLKYCHLLKKQRDDQEQINYLCYIHAYKIVYDHLCSIADLAMKLLDASELTTLKNMTIPLVTKRITV